jgi:dipeptidyl aminopeptidase/acylaminoacyl peptidase
MNDQYSIGGVVVPFIFRLILISVTLLTFNVSAETLANVIKMSEASRPAPLLPRSQFMQIKPLHDVSLSPDGQFLSYIQIKQKHSELWLLDIKQNSHRMLFSNKDMDESHWSTDSQFIFVQNNKGLMGVSVAENSFPKLITDIDENKDQYFYAVDVSHNQAVITSEKNLKTNVHQLVRVLTDGSRQILYSGQQRVLDFLLGDKGQVNFIKQINAGGADLLDVRQNPVRLLKHCVLYNACSLQSYDAQSNLLLVNARLGQDLLSLFSIHIETLNTQLLHQDPKGQFDLGTVYFDIKGKPRLAVYRDHFVSHYGLDEETQRQLVSIQSKLTKLTKLIKQDPDWIFRPDTRFERWVAIDISPNKSLSNVYLYDSKTQNITRPLAHLLDSLEIKNRYIRPQYLAQKISIEYQTSDGMQQFGYVTLPLGRIITEVPLVVVPHGGPWSRVTGGYDRISQLLANRGYAVFEPNFRGSTGMGSDYVLAANQDFGNGRVQQDIIDGMEYLISQGVGDRQKLAIYGHSFGGFSTLAALAFTPNLFKVGIAGAPPTDLAQSLKMLGDQRQNDRQQLKQLTVNSLAVDPSDLRAMQQLYEKSPDAHWQKIRQPLYMLAGGQDDRVSVARVKEFAIRLRQANKPISLLVDEKEGHSFKHDIAREAYAYVLEKALAKHLHTDYQQDVSINLKRYLKRNIVIDNNALLPITK